MTANESDKISTLCSMPTSPPPNDTDQLSKSTGFHDGDMFLSRPR